MSDEATYIVDEALPEYVDFNVLNARAIEFLKQSAGEVWTNFNPADPGVTILEQLGYALTELGYCAQFPIEDVLTGPDGTIQFDGQFFQAQDILTCSPVTVDDHRRLVLDAFKQVHAIYIDFERDKGGTPTTGLLRSRVALRRGSSPVTTKTVLNQLYVFLNQQRNLGEMFAPPIELKERQIIITGELVLASGANQAAVIEDLCAKLDDYATPRASQQGFTAWVGADVPADQIFNGPTLQNGWMPGSAGPPPKRLQIVRTEVAQIVASVSGVAEARSISLTEEGKETGEEIVTVSSDEIVNFASKLTVRHSNASSAASAQASAVLSVAALQAGHRARAALGAMDIAPPIPAGRYRDIASYVSVQCTMPETYGTGQDSTLPDDGTFRDASTRQLKGYLMMFDQMLANEFAQLAHLGDLLSFGHGESHTGQHERQRPSMLVSRNFVTTYFCRPLYDVPGVMPLLRGNDMFNFSLDRDQPPALRQQEAWRKFQGCEFNEYIEGLHQALESDESACARRDAILSHLLARHGVDPVIFDMIVDANQWYGSRDKTRILAKSVWLQNFQFLSYYRNRACDVVTGFRHEASKWKDQTTQQLWEEVFPHRAGELDKNAYFKLNKLTPAALQKCSTYELILELMLGLTKRYRAVVAQLTLLIEEHGFKSWLLRANPESDSFVHPNGEIQVKRKERVDEVSVGGQLLITVLRQPDVSDSLDDYRNHIDQLEWLARRRTGCLLIEHVPLGFPEFAASAASGKEPDLWYSAVTLIIPGYINAFSSDQFHHCLESLKKQYWPVHLVQKLKFVRFDKLDQVISAYAVWCKQYARYFRSQFENDVHPVEEESTLPGEALSVAARQLRELIELIEPLPVPEERP